MKPIRILHVPTNTGNNPWTLSMAERKLGLKSDLIIFKSHKFYQNFDKNLNLNYWSIPGEIKKYIFFKKILKNYDIFHFNFGFSFLDYPYIGLDYLDFKILKKAQKKIIMTFQGSDARQKAYFLKNFGEGPFPSQNYSLRDWLVDWRRQKRLVKLTKYADKIYALNPDLLYVLPKTAEFMPYAIEPQENTSNKKIEEHQTINIVHAPSHRFAKGTDYIFPVIGRLKEKYSFNFLLVENISHTKTQKIFDQADIAIDQLLVGWYGAFAVEMMARAIPVLAYVRSRDAKKFVNFSQEIPIINTNKNTLEENLDFLIKQPKLRKKIGQKSKSFTLKHHHPINIASRLKKVYSKLLDENDNI